MRISDWSSGVCSSDLDAPDDLEAVALWQDALQRVGCSEPSVRAAWDALMSSTARGGRAANDASPRAAAARAGADGAHTTIQHGSATSRGRGGPDVSHAVVG